MQEFNNSSPLQNPTVSPEWELFRIVKQMSWTELSHEPQQVLLDMYRSSELGLSLQTALTSPKLKHLADKHGKDMVCRLIGLVVMVYVSRFPTKPETNWGAWRLHQTAEWLYDTYTMESLRDVMYAFRRSQGKYVHDLSEIITDYLDWRAAKLEAAHQARSQGLVSEWPGDLKEKLPDRWFLGYLNQPNGNKDQTHNKQKAA